MDPIALLYEIVAAVRPAHGTAAIASSATLTMKPCHAASCNRKQSSSSVSVLCATH